MDSQLAPPSFAPVTFSHPISPIGDVVRLLGEQTTGGLVLMSGLEERAGANFDFRNTPYQEVVAQLAGAIECDYLHTPYYYMILPSEYALLQELTINEYLDSRHSGLTASVAFGAKTELYNVLAALGESLDITIIADNFLAEAHCGEMFLSDAPFPVILEAILRSTRLTPDSFAVENTPEYIFIHTTQNNDTDSRLLNRRPLTPEQQSLLDRIVSVSLPNENTAAQTPFTAAPIALRDALLPLTEQLGIEIVAHRRLADIPINPCLMKNVRLETALNLLLRQWPLPDFGFEIQENRILLREK
ncbi:MAG TPA: hypothetical protein ENN29_01765 [Candidatus Hydrogenedentes bacterium]|nr:hypothetical protein [Candidatus Hydrogenedentota bacterium]